MIENIRNLEYLPGEVEIGGRDNEYQGTFLKPQNFPISAHLKRSFSNPLSSVEKKMIDLGEGQRERGK